MRLAALNATDLQDYQRRLLRVMPSRDAVEMGLLVAYFEPRFNEWWASSGAKAAAEMTRNLKEAVYEHAMVDLAQQIALFTEAQIEPGHALYFNLMVRPHQYGSGVAGTQIQNHMIAEMSLKDPAGMRLSLLMHELTHHFYDIAPVSRHTALLDSFINAPEPSALGLYTYLNEALATAVGLLVDHRIHTPRAFVQHVADDRRVSLDPVAARLALGLYGVIEKHMRQRRTLFEGFAPLYLSASYRALGERARGPQLELASRTVIARNPRAVPALTEFANRVRAITTLSGRKALLDYPQLSAVIFLMTGELNWLLRNSGIIPSELRSELRTASKENAAFVYALRRSEKANVYIFIGDDEHALVAAQRAFSASDEPFSGLRFATRRTTATN